MATPKNPAERIAKLDEKMAQLAAQKKAILAREKAAEEKRLKAELYREYGNPERRARTKRLIEIGAEVEAALGVELTTPELRKALGDFLREQDRRGNYATNAIKAGRAPAEDEQA